MLACPLQPSELQLVQSAWLKLATFLGATSSQDPACHHHAYGLQQQCDQRLTAIWQHSSQ